MPEKLDVFKLIMKLRKARRNFCLSAGSQGLFYELVAICNEEIWPDVFKCSNGDLQAALNGIEEKTLIKYRNELIEAGLISFLSGRNKKEKCQYSLNGWLLDCTEDCSLGSKKDSPMAGKKTDINIKLKTKSKTKTLEEEVVSARAAEIDEAIENYFNHLPSEEKEKKVATKKEIELAAYEEALKKIADTANWGNVLEFKLLSPEIKVAWADMDSVEREPYLQERRDLFSEFYAYKQDHYRIAGLPTWNNMAQNFYHWVEIQKNKGLLKKLNSYANGSAKYGNGNTKHSASEDRQARNRSVDDIIEGSSAFLQRFADIDPESGFPE